MSDSLEKLRKEWLFRDGTIADDLARAAKYIAALEAALTEQTAKAEHGGRILAKNHEMSTITLPKLRKENDELRVELSRRVVPMRVEDNKDPASCAGCGVEEELGALRYAATMRGPYCTECFSIDRKKVVDLERQLAEAREILKCTENNAKAVSEYHDEATQQVIELRRQLAEVKNRLSDQEGHTRHEASTAEALRRQLAEAREEAEKKAGLADNLRSDYRDLLAKQQRNVEELWESDGEKYRLKKEIDDLRAKLSGEPDGWIVKNLLEPLGFASVTFQSLADAEVFSRSMNREDWEIVPVKLVRLDEPNQTDSSRHHGNENAAPARSDSRERPALNAVQFQPESSGSIRETSDGNAEEGREDARPESPREEQRHEGAESGSGEEGEVTQGAGESSRPDFSTSRDGSLIDSGKGHAAPSTVPSRPSSSPSKIGKFCEKRCPRCGCTVLRNELGEEWCSNAGGRFSSSCSWGLKDPHAADRDPTGSGEVIP